jgi:hypothetical protein
MILHAIDVSVFVKNFALPFTVVKLFIKGYKGPLQSSSDFRLNAKTTLINRLTPTIDCAKELIYKIFSNFRPDHGKINDFPLLIHTRL